MDNRIAVRLEAVLKTFGGQPNPWVSSRPGYIPHGAQVALDHVSLEVRQGEIVGLAGLAGSGKSTLLRLVAGQLAPDAGRVTVLGYDTLRQARQARALVGRIQTQAGLWQKLSPLENLLYAARQYGLTPAEARQHIREIVARLGLDEQAASQPLEALGPVWQVRIAVARACLAPTGVPRLLLWDDPAAGPESQTAVQAGPELLTCLRELRETHGTTVLLASRDAAALEALCDRMAVLDQGRLAPAAPAAVRVAQAKTLLQGEIL